MEIKKIQELYERYSSIKSRAMAGHRISRNEAKEALRLKKKLNDLNYKEKLGIQEKEN
jgi:hypothetical protein